MTRPLAGLLVVAIEQAVAAPLCTARLADAGARVIKIERPEGDTARHYDAAVHGMSAYFAWLNRGKESLVLDLKSAGDRHIVETMLGKADIFVQNLAPGAAERLGLGAAQLVARFPRLIAVDIVGYGRDTASGGLRAYDLLVQAESGLCSVTGSPERPAKVGVSAADICTGMNAHAAIVEALYARERNGKGAAIEMAMFDGLADWMNVPLLHHDYAGRMTERFGLAHASIYPYRPYACRDGEVVIVAQNADEWARLCRRVLARPELIDDPRFGSNTARLTHRVALDQEIAPVFAALTTSEAIERLAAAGLAWGRVSTVADLSTHPALRRIACRAPGGMFELAAPPLHPDLTAVSVPALGEHSAAIRREFSPEDQKA
ncbi:CoA transferase [Nordella sp. HKS 07]|uniref:CaiB/BaiF CoA transferase family protein n=1 Tax=Nordella sp. HKS 07 TaxID=2712222 RepID=UPI0013E17F36|nr:CaiB/BaiF CoA-transferase family protein [Nordella sp. HKS 07]QIG46945.1 CoA transferase [Nordella sp. HKS 07]